MTDLGTLGGTSGHNFAGAINDRGQVVGGSVTGTRFESHAFLWEDGEMVDMGTLGGTSGHSGSAFDINSRGQVVGDGAVLWTK